MKASVIIPTYNRCAVLLGKTLPALERQNYGNNAVEIIIIDDGSSDNTPSLLDDYAASHGRVKVYHQSNSGSAKARNSAIRKATGDIVVIMGDDTYPPNDDFIMEHCKYHAKADSNCAMLGLTIWDPDIETPFMRWIQDNNQQFRYSTMRDKTYVDFECLYTSNISFNRQYLFENGVFMDERFKHYGFEDTEWGYRLQKHCALKIFYNASALLHHYHAYTPATFARRNVIIKKAAEMAKTINREFYDKCLLEHNHARRFKHFLFRILVGKRVLSCINENMNLERYPKIFWKLILKLISEKLDRQSMVENGKGKVMRHIT